METISQTQRGIYTLSYGVGTTAVWYPKLNVVYIIFLMVLVQQQHGIHTRWCSSALRGACTSCVLVWLCGHRGDDALPPRACSSCSVAPRACSFVLVGFLYASMLVKELTLCHRSSRARILWCTRGVGTTIGYIYILARSSSRALAYLWC